MTTAASPSTEAAPAAPRRPSWAKRIFSWVLAVVALAFVAWVVPVRDRCEDPLAAAPASAEAAPRVPISRDASGCVLHRAAGDASISAEACAALTCEPGLGSTLKSARIDVLLALLVLYFAGTLAWAARWRFLLTLAGIPVTLMNAWAVTLKAQAGGILLPGGVGGDALRIAAMVGRGAKTSIVVASVMLDRAIGMVTIAGLAAFFGLALGGGAGDGDAQRVALTSWILAAIPVGFVVGLFVLRLRWVREHRLFDLAAPGLRGKVARIVAPVLAYIGDPKARRAIVIAVLTSLFVSAVQLACVRGFVWAVGGVPVEEKWIYVGTAMAMIIAIVPALPGGWGTVDAAYIFFLGPKLAGLSTGVALTACLLYRLFWYLSGVAGAVLHLASGAGKAPAESPDNASPP